MPETTAIKRLYESGVRAKEALKNLRRREQAATNGLVLRAGTSAAAIFGAVGAGAIDGKWGHDNPPNEDEKNNIAHAGPVPINIGLGLVGMVVGISGVLPGSEYIASLGAGLVGYPLGKVVEAKVSTPKAAK